MYVRIVPLPLTLLLCFGTAAESSAASTDIADADTIVVTASRTPLARSEIGSSTTIITREQIERLQARFVTDLLRAVPGFSVSQAGPRGAQTQVRVRGAEANHVLVLIDGIRANDAAGGDEFRWEYLTTGNVDHIEIVRGPQTALWGSDALSAVVNVITVPAAHTRPVVNGYVEGGSHATRNLGVNASTGGDRWQLGFGVEQLLSDGINVSRFGAERDGSDVQTASLNGRVDVSNQLTLDFGVRKVDAYTEIDPIDFFVSGLPADGDLANDGERLYARVAASLNSPEWDVQQRLSVNFLETENRNLAAGVADAQANSERLNVGYQIDLHIADNVLSFAAESEQTEFVQRGDIIFGDPNQIQEMTVNSIIGDYQFRATDAMTWLFSLRYDDSSDFGDVVTGRIAGSWHATDTTRIYFNAATGQKAPTFIERFGFFPGQFVGNPELKPEQSNSYEFGVELVRLDERLNGTLALFRQDLRDEINGFVFDPVSFLTTAENRSGRSKRQGLEITARLLATDELSLEANYTYTDSTENTPTGAVDEIRRPRHSGYVGADYRFLDERGSVHLSANYNGTRSDTFFPPFPQPTATVSLQHYWLVDMTVSYAITDSLNLFIRAANLLDEDYEHVFGYATEGRTAYIGASASFGR